MPFLARTMNEMKWEMGEEAFQKTKQPTLVHKSYDGFEFWVVEHEGEIVRKTVYGDNVFYSYIRTKPLQQS